MASNCKHKSIGLKFLKNKKIAVDIFIYLYKYLKEDKLYDRISEMCLTFIKYNIKPIFVFDGKPPIEKQEELKARLNVKVECSKKINTLLGQLEQEDNNMSQEEKKKIKKEIIKLKENTLTINNNMIDTVKKLISAYGMTYITAIGEADELCAYLTINKTVYATLSEDTDMFVYGCPRVIKDLDLENNTYSFYNLYKILSNLDIIYEHFKCICIFSGTDYNKTKYNLWRLFKLYNKFRKNKSNIPHGKQIFKLLCGYFKEDEGYRMKLLDTYKLYSFKNYELSNNKTYNNINIENRNYHIDKVKSILKNKPL